MGIDFPPVLIVFYGIVCLVLIGGALAASGTRTPGLVHPRPEPKPRPKT
jgi:hypothetical protein